MIRGRLRGVKEWMVEWNIDCQPYNTTQEERDTEFMTMKLTYPDGSTEILPEATRVDEQNFHEGMYDFYDERGTLLRQIDMHTKVKWELIDAEKDLSK